MVINEEIFTSLPKLIYSDWQKTLKKDGHDKFLRVFTFEGIKRSIFYEADIKAINLASFPAQQVKLEFSNEKYLSEKLIANAKELGIEFFFMANDTPQKMVSRENCKYILNKDHLYEVKDFPAGSIINTHHLVFDNFLENISNLKKSLNEPLFMIDTSYIHNAGASISQELCYGLNLYTELIVAGVKTNQIIIKLAVDSELFLMTAKLRALRYMLEKINNLLELENDFKLATTSSLREQTLYDPWSNILRNTTSAMAQIWGGSDFISCKPYDYLYAKLTGEKYQEVSYRYSCQTLNILFEESKLSGFIDPMKGSSLIENLTFGLIQNSWSLYLNWSEKNIFKNIKDFSIEVKAIGQERLKRVRTREITITGINNFASSQETINSLYKVAWKPTELSYGLFPPRRLAMDYERLRLKFEHLDKKPTVFFVTNSKDHSLQYRLNFIKNIFDCFGIDYHLKDTLAVKENCDVLVLIDHDENYLKLINSFLNFHGLKYFAGDRDKCQLEHSKEWLELKTGQDFVNVFENLYMTYTGEQL